MMFIPDHSNEKKTNKQYYYLCNGRELHYLINKFNIEVFAFCVNNIINILKIQ